MARTKAVLSCVPAALPAIAQRRRATDGRGRMWLNRHRSEERTEGTRRCGRGGADGRGTKNGGRRPGSRGFRHHAEERTPAALLDPRPLPLFSTGLAGVPQNRGSTQPISCASHRPAGALPTRRSDRGRLTRTEPFALEGGGAEGRGDAALPRSRANGPAGTGSPVSEDDGSTPTERSTTVPLLTPARDRCMSASEHGQRQLRPSAETPVGAGFHGARAAPAAH